MGLFDWFSKKRPEPKPEPEPEQQPTISLPQLCYDVAYFILPHYAYNDIEKVVELCFRTPSAAGLFFYVMACMGRKVEPVPDDGRLFCWHHGPLTESREYFALEYPTPSPVDMSDLPIEQMVSCRIVLAPHFSAIIRDTSSGETDYFVLGQAPMGGGTTLRCVTREGANCNLGPGPEPRLEEFLDAVRERLVGRSAPQE